MPEKKNTSEIKKKNEGSKDPKTTNKEAKDSPPSSSSPQNPKKQRDATRALVIILAVVAVVVGLVYVYPFFTAMFGKQKEVFTNVDQLGQRVVKLEEELHKTDDKLNEFQATVAKDYAQKDSLELLKHRLDTLEKQQKSLANVRVTKELGGLLKKDAKMSKSLQNLMDRVDSLEKEHALRQIRITKIPSVLREFAKLKELSQSTKPFVVELSNAISLTDPNDPSVKPILPRLKEIAKRGVPSYEQLTHEFSLIVRQLKHQSGPNNLPWYKKFVQRMQSLIVVKKKEGPIFGGSDVDKTLLEIQKELNKRDLGAVLSLTNKLPKFNLKSYNSWLQQVNDLYFLNNSFPILETSALNYLLKDRKVSS